MVEWTANGGEPATGVGEDGQIETETGGEQRGSI